ncbi:hypothetical protein EXE46_09035 [Halorubrum sp. GN11_10-6_MGM]|uniref:O-antigen ligase family protein n=1 Tax=Halorubrum sp. GN11_10-6_MGM TaxID=2518112 RepID=UPI0010F5FAF7|nr:O-antigen ligase family protein [Halorubrum sp. GN11_10-6_MGM]TKX74495.1 hypothetical protein EXE46_09035 [Halorubrum sp. GN11_10-6_MGM]
MYTRPDAVIIFFFEYYLNIVLFLSVVVAARHIDEDIILNILLILGIVQSLVLIDIALGMDAIRRIGNTELPIGVNHLSHALGAAFVIGITKYQYNKHHKKLIILSLLILALGIALTGSRSSIIGVSLAIVALFSLQNKSTIIKNIQVVTIILFGVTVFGVVFVNFSGGGINRFTEGILSSLLGRFDLYLEALRELSSGPIASLIGIGVSNYGHTPGGSLVGDPHNFWISLTLYLGIPVGLAFLFLHLLIGRQLIQVIINQTDQKETEIAIFLMLIVVSTYIFFSGRVTRIYTIWIVLGLAVSRYTQYLNCS